MGEAEDGIQHVGSKRILIAPDKFRGSLSSSQVASAIARGLLRGDVDLIVDQCPIADGGEGTLEAALSAGFERVLVEVEGPTGDPVVAAYGQREGIALIELAEAVGLQRLPGGILAPLTASTFGMGQLAAAAIEAGNKTIVLAIGGSSSSDGGAGLLEGLGAELLDASGSPVSRGGAALAVVDRISTMDMATRLDGARFIVASDVTSPLLGPSGAAVIFGPQKGASPDDVEVLEYGLSRWAAVVTEITGFDATELPGAGAAGGVGFGAMALLGASVVRGADLVLDLVGFAARVRDCALVITGEGSIDEQTMSGKAPIRVANASRSAGVPTIAAVGRCLVSEVELRAAGIERVYSLETLEPDQAASIANADVLLERMAEQIAADFGASLQP